jgi:hypothetical protein
MRVIDIAERFVYRSDRRLFVAVALLFSFVKTGIWSMPNFDVWAPMRFDPFHNAFARPSQHYMFWNWLGPFLAWRLRIHNLQSFFCFHLFFSMLFTATFLCYIFATFSDKDARTALVLFLAVPASATAYFWVGMDSITLALMMLLLVLRTNSIVAFLVAILLGMQHAEQGVCAFAALLFALALSKYLKCKTEFQIGWAAAGLAGVLVGKVILILIFRHYGIDVNSGRVHYAGQFALLAVPSLGYHFQFILFSILGVGWIAVAKFLQTGRKAVPLVIALLGLMALLLVVIDQTRVLAIVSFPLFAAYLALNREFLQSVSTRFGTWLFGLWLIVPWPWVWLGQPRVSVFPYDVAWLLHRWFGWFSVPASPFLWPF